MTQRTALYARVSTTRQQEERTVASQLAALTAADGLLDLVLVYAPDRLARNYVHQQIDA